MLKIYIKKIFIFKSFSISNRIRIVENWKFSVLTHNLNKYNFKNTNFTSPENTTFKIISKGLTKIKED